MSLELVLLEHYDDFWQWTPFALFGTSTFVLLWYGFTRRALAIRVFRTVMAAFIAGGALGVYLHYDSNAMFEREMSPEVLGWALFQEAIFGATPALAPGVMVQLGLLGLAFTIRHPALEAPGAQRRDVEDRGETWGASAPPPD
jgi:hypothetical protein